VVTVEQMDRKAAEDLVAWLTERLMLEGPGKLAVVQHIEREFAAHRIAAATPATSEVVMWKARAESLEQQLAAMSVLCGDDFIQSVHDALDRGGAPRKSGDGNITYGIVRRIEALSPSPALGGAGLHVVDEQPIDGGEVEREREGCARTAQRYIENMGSMTAREAGRGVALAIRNRALTPPQSPSDQGEKA
jgi:hypothetical protein